MQKMSPSLKTQFYFHSDKYCYKNTSASSFFTIDKTGEVNAYQVL